MTGDTPGLDIDPTIDYDDPRLDAVDALIARWHKIPLAITAPPLAEYLGLTFDQYAAYACRNELPEGYVPPNDSAEDIWEPLRVMALVAAIIAITVAGLLWSKMGGQP